MEKFDLFLKIIDLLQQMTLTIQQSNCQEKSKSEKVAEEPIIIDEQVETQLMSKDQEASDKKNDDSDSDNEDDKEARTQEVTINELLSGNDEELDLEKKQCL